MQPRGRRLPGNAGSDRADLGAGAAVVAAVGVDEVAVAAVTDRLLGALGLAGAADDALLGDAVGHGVAGRFAPGAAQEERRPSAGCFWQAGQRCVPRPLTRM